MAAVRQAAASSAGASTGGSGLVAARGSFGVHRLGAVQFAESADGFGTLLGTVSLGVLLTEGRGPRFMYEAVLGSAGLQQIGWTKPSCLWSREDGVGDFACSFGLDGFRSLLWKNTKNIPYNISWESGDVIGCCIDATVPASPKLIFYKNGMVVNTPEPIDVYNPADVASIVPGVSLSHRERILINLGTKPFMFVLFHIVVLFFFSQQSCSFTYMRVSVNRYPVEGFAPVVVGASNSDKQAAAYLAGCVERLFVIMNQDRASAEGEVLDEYVVLLAQVLEFYVPLLTPYHIAQSFVPLVVSLCQDGYQQSLSLLFDSIQSYVDVCPLFSCHSCCFFTVCTRGQEMEFSQLINELMGNIALDWLIIPSHVLARQCVPEDLSVPDADLEGRIKLALPFEGTATLDSAAMLCRMFRVDKYVSDHEFWIVCMAGVHSPAGTDLLFLYPRTWWPCKISDGSLNKTVLLEASRRSSKMLSIVRTKQAEIFNALHEQNLLVPFLESAVDQCKDYRKSVCVFFPPHFHIACFITCFLTGYSKRIARYHFGHKHVFCFAHIGTKFHGRRS